MSKLFDYYFKLLLFNTNDSSYELLEEKKKSILLHLFLYLFFLAISVSLVSNIFRADYTTAIFNVSCLIVGLLTFYLLRKGKNIFIPSLIFVIVISVISTYFFLTGGSNNSGIAFMLMLPLPVILILGKERGLLALSIFFVLNAVAYYGLKEFSWSPGYNISLICRLSIVFFFISAMAFANEYVFEILYGRLEKISSSLKTSQQRYKNLALNREKFLSVISHDLSDHIGSFMSISTLLNEQYDEISEEDRMKLIKQMANVSKNNYKLLEDLLKWSTVQLDHIPYSPTAFKLERIYREVIELFNPLLEGKKLSIFLKMKSNSEIFADYHMASAILRNLVSNAIKFSHLEGEIRISAVEKEDKMLVTVSDRGIGMSEELLLRFNSSLSFSNPGTIQEPGTGIGLILTKEFVQKNEGELFIKSVPNEGTEVSFTLPLVD
ncbi:sensor histidine kinase [Sunxiuqinia indica]|uniref:sensor histidine kinase n=1 Tax=Sunxiuqinia indica TaxID=2692584 RepID=UPI00135A18E2|nr:HAMP domain-containing sensor histidine kinase [Sunxiuqinia indica]